MKQVLFLLFITFQLSVFSQVEMRYNSSTEDLPNWVQLMYVKNPDEGTVIEAYRSYYKSHKLVKNQHTQYYKRWVRNLSRTTTLPQTKKNSKSMQNIFSWLSTSNSITIDWGAIPGGPHTLEVIESNGGCSSALVTLDVTIVDSPTATAGPNGDICVGDIYSLSSATATNQMSVLWTAPLGDGIFTNASSLNPDYTPGPNDIIAGTVDLTLTVTGNSPCLSISSTMTLTVVPNPTPGPIFHN